MSATPDRTPRNMLVIVAKYPEPMRVKTRLGAAIGHDRAAALYTAFLRDLAARFETASQPDAPWTLRWACATGSRPPEALRAVVGARARVFSQRGADFATRLYHIAEDARGFGALRLVIMSSDAPQIPAALVAEAFATVGQARALADVALSPAEDGGYSLIALRLPEPPAAPPDLFRGIHMSTATVLAETLARAEALGLRTALLEPAFDVDEAADLGRLWQALRPTPALAPRSYAALAQLFTPPAKPDRTGNEADHDTIAARW